MEALVVTLNLTAKVLLVISNIVDLKISKCIISIFVTFDISTTQGIRMGMVLLLIFLIALSPAVVLGLFLWPKNQKEWFCAIAITVLIGGFSWIAMGRIIDPLSTSKGFSQLRFFIILLGLSPSIGMIFAKLISLLNK